MFVLLSLRRSIINSVVAHLIYPKLLLMMFYVDWKFFLPDCPADWPELLLEAFLSKMISMLSSLWSPSSSSKYPDSLLTPSLFLSLHSGTVWPGSRLDDDEAHSALIFSSAALGGEVWGDDVSLGVVGSPASRLAGDGDLEL